MRTLITLLLIVAAFVAGMNVDTLAEEKECKGICGSTIRCSCGAIIKCDMRWPHVPYPCWNVCPRCVWDPNEVGDD